MKPQEMMEKYKKFNACLESMVEDGKQLPSYEEICLMIGVSPLLLENLLYGELGLSGEEVVDSYRN